MITEEKRLLRAKELNNSGGPRSRVRSESIKKNYLEESAVASVSGIISVPIPKNVNDLEWYYLNMAKELGWNSWQEAVRNLPMPEGKKIIIETDEVMHNATLNKYDILKNALVLAKCNQVNYQPDGEMIFTHKRLDRKVKLYNIQLNKFYELD